jgi:alpha-L-arabinofuranosidase
MLYMDIISLKALPAPSVVNVTVDATQTGRTRLFVVNAAVLDSIFDTLATIDLLDEMGNQALRFPGGSLPDDYHWATNTTDSNSWQWATSFTQFAQVATATGAHRLSDDQRQCVQQTPGHQSEWNQNQHLSRMAPAPANP